MIGETQQSVCPHQRGAARISLRRRSSGIITTQTVGLLLLLLRLVVPTTLQAQIIVEYRTNNGAITITGYWKQSPGSGGALSIPSSIHGLPVTSVAGISAVFGTSDLTSVRIPDTVTNIAQGAFIAVGTSSLGAIEVDPNNSAYSSADGVLFNKSQTTLIRYPKVSAKGYQIPEGVTAIGTAAFMDCINLASVRIPAGITSIGSAAFARCHSLKNLIIPSGVTNIGNHAFLGCLRLAEAVIPDSVTSIGAEAFYYCTNLTTIAIPRSLVKADFAFYHCDGLTAITVDMLNPAYSSLDGVLFNKSSTTLIQCPARKAGSYTVPESVTTIYRSAFERCVSLTSITIPTGVTNIEESAFCECISLNTITVEAANPAYGSVDGVLFNRGRTALISCPAGKAGSYPVPRSVTIIGGNAFRGCRRLTAITIHSSVTGIGEAAFSGCTGLKAVHFQGDAPTISGDDFELFRGDDNTTVYYMPATKGWTPTFGDRPTAPTSLVPASRK